MWELVFCPLRITLFKVLVSFSKLKQTLPFFSYFIDIDRISMDDCPLIAYCFKLQFTCFVILAFLLIQQLYVKLTTGQTDVNEKHTKAWSFTSSPFTLWSSSSTVKDLHSKEPLRIDFEID